MYVQAVTLSSFLPIYHILLQVITMRKTVFALSLLAFIFIANAIATTEEDQTQQEIETQVMARSNARKVKQATTKAPAINNKNAIVHLGQ